MLNLLVPVDLSPNSELALNYACDLAQKLPCKITAFHSYPLPAGNPFLSIESIIELEKQGAIDAKMRLSNFLQVFLHKRSGSHAFEILPLTRLGFAVENIINLTEVANFDLIIMGTKGANNVKTKLLGTNTACVIDNIHRPVLVVPSQVKFNGLESIIFATNITDFRFSESSILVELAKAHQSKIYLIHIVKEGKESNEQELKQLLDLAQYQLGYSNIEIIEMSENNLESKLNHYAQRVSASVIAVTIQHRNIFQKIFYPNISTDLFYYSNTPLLAMHNV